MKASQIAAGVVLAGSALFASESVAHADLLTPLGARGQFVMSQMSGFRAGTAANPGGGGFSYSGILGFNYSSYSQATPGAADASTSYSFTSFWFAPSADFFPIDHLTIGGLFEISATLNSRTAKLNGNSITTDLPTTVNFTILPRVGWMFAIGDRFAIWPRVGAGYMSRQYAGTNDTKFTFAGFVLDVDTTFLLRINETFFAGLTPEFTFVPGSATQTSGANSASASASAISFSVLGGIGIIL